VKKLIVSDIEKCHSHQLRTKFHPTLPSQAPCANKTISDLRSNRSTTGDSLCNLRKLLRKLQNRSGAKYLLIDSKKRQVMAETDVLNEFGTLKKLSSFINKFHV
jgi:hypothetical protein